MVASYACMHTMGLVVLSEILLRMRHSMVLLATYQNFHVIKLLLKRKLHQVGHIWIAPWVNRCDPVAELGEDYSPPKIMNVLI